MARNQQHHRPVSEEEYEQMPDRISEHFDRMRDLFREKGVDIETARERAANGHPETDDGDDADGE